VAIIKRTQYDLIVTHFTLEANYGT